MKKKDLDKIIKKYGIKYVWLAQQLGIEDDTLHLSLRRGTNEQRTRRIKQILLERSRELAAEARAL